MKRHITILLLALALISVLSGCDLMTSIFGSSEAAITTFTQAGMVGEPVIDAKNATVTLTVEPMDLAGFAPEITISEGAIITAPESITDGVAATYTVTAENGDIVDWKVTVNVQYGMSFFIGTEKVVLTEGVTDSTNDDNNAKYGNGVPGIDVLIIDDSTMSTGMAFDDVFDSEDEYPSGDTASFILAGDTASTYTAQNFAFADYADSTTEPIRFKADFNVTEFGSVGKTFRATFNGEAEDGTKLTSGFAKLLVVESYPIDN